MTLESVQIDQTPGDTAELDGWALSKEAFEWIDAHLEPRDHILELGSGHGSVILSEKYRVSSVEHDRTSGIPLRGAA